MSEEFLGGTMKTNRQFTIRETLVLATLTGTWLTITIQLASASVLFWIFAVVMGSILRPAHQRHRTPESATDLLTVAITWSVACGIGGLALDMRLPDSAFSGLLSWSMLGQLTGFYLGFVWTFIVLVVRRVERIVGPLGRARPVAQHR